MKLEEVDIVNVDLEPDETLLVLVSPGLAIIFSGITGATACARTSPGEANKTANERPAKSLS